MRKKEFTVSGITYTIEMATYQGALTPVAVRISQIHDGICETCGDGRWTGMSIADMEADLDEDVYTAAEMACIDLDG